MMNFFRTAKLATMTLGSALLLFSCNQQQTDNKLTLDVSLINKDVKPADDFYHFANDGWMNENPLPDDESRFGTFDQLAKETNEKVKDLILELSEQDNAPGSIAQKIGTFYSVGMDTARIEAMGYNPIKADLEKIQQISSLDDVQNQIIYFHENGIRTLFGFGGGIDSKNSEMIIAQIGAGGIGMSDRDYYTNQDDRSVELRAAYLDYIAHMFNLIGTDEETARAHAKTILEFETSLAENMLTRLERRDPNKTYNKMTWEEVNKTYKNFNWVNYLDARGLGHLEEVNVSQPQFLERINVAISETPVDTWKTYFTWNLLNSAAPYLNEDFVNASFDFYGKTLQGSEKIRERWRRVLSATNGALGQPIGQEFTKKHFPPEAKERMVALVENLRDALGYRIENLEWMGEETKAEAQDKLAAMRVKIGYPDKWRDFSDLEITDESYWKNVMTSRRFDNQYNLSQIGKPVDKEEWFMNPQTVNAYYAPNLNEICFPAGILQPPFFYIDGDDAINYGAIGCVIGHEMTHGFDDQGRLYTKEGNLENWWTDEDSKRFTERANVLVEQYDKIIVLDTVYANGKLSLGENIADLGGLNISYTALKKAQETKQEPAKIDGYTQDQRFFLAWARVWAQNIRDKEILRRTKEDVHSLGINRVNGPLKNMPEFHQAFNIGEGDAMYLHESQRAIIW